MDNKAADALSRRLCTLQALIVEVIGFECLIQDYPTYQDFGEIYTSLIREPPTLVEDYTIVDGILFTGTRLCIPNTSLVGYLIWEMHVGVSLDTLAKTRPLPWYKINFIGLVSSVMLRELCHMAKCVRLPRVGNRTHGFTHLCLFHLHLGSISV